jgi:hypothetical protein
MKRKLAIALASGVLATGIVGASTPAFAAIDFETATWSVGGINYEFENTGADAYMGSLQFMQTATQSNYEAYYATEFYVNNDSSGNVNDDYAYCLENLATEATDTATGDVTISCGEYAWSVSDPDLFASGSTRFYDDIPMARNVYVLENRGTTDVDLGETYFYEYLDNYNRGASSENPTSCAALTAEDHWLVSSDTDDSMIIGFAWQAHGSPAFDATGEDCTSDSVYTYLTDAILPAGKTLTVMNFQYSVDGGSTTEDMDAAYAALLPTMDMFEALDDTLCRGIEVGTQITGWGTCAPAAPAAPALPDTGADTSVIGASVAISAGLLGAGVLALIMVRRRQSAQ